MLLANDAQEAMPTIARILARTFSAEDARCMAFPSERYMHWPLKLDRRKDTARSYQTGIIENDGARWSFMVEVGDQDGRRNGAKSESWFKFYAIKQEAKAPSQLADSHKELAQKKVKFIRKRAFPGDISQLQGFDRAYLSVPKFASEESFVSSLGPLTIKPFIVKVELIVQTPNGVVLL